MLTSDLPLFSMMKSRMRWHQERQRLLAENVANAETPGFRSRDLRPPSFGDMLTGGAGRLAQPTTAISRLGSPGVTDPRHIAFVGSSGRFETNRDGGVQTTPDGNAVNLEDEMLKVAQNQQDFQAVSGLYQRSLGLIRTAVGRRGGG